MLLCNPLQRLRCATAPLVLLLAMVQTAAAAADSVSTADSARMVEGRQVVISASRWAERASTVSRQIAVITPEDVRMRNPATAADLLEGTGEVYMQRSQAGGGSPRLRGFAANNVLMVIDGIRLNNLIYRTGNLQNLIQVDASSIAGAEVLFGPGSVQYGSDALGGVMVFRTKEPVFSSAEQGFTIRGEGFARYASAAAERTLGAEVDLSWNKVASYTSVTVSRFDDLRSGGTFPQAQPTFGRRDWYVQRIGGRDTMLVNADPLLQKFSGYDQLNLLQKLRWQISDNWTLGLTALFTTSGDIPRYDRLFELRTTNGVTLPRQAEWYYGPQFLSLNALTLTGHAVASFMDDLSITISQQWYRESRHARTFRSDVRRDQYEDVAVTNLNADARLRLYEGTEDRDLYYGIEVSLQGASSSATDVNIANGQQNPGVTRYPDGGSTYNSYAAYVQTRWDLSDELTVAGGLRGTLVQLRSEVSDVSVFRLPYETIQTDPSALTGSIGLTWSTTSWLTIRGNASTGFRAPNVDDIGKVFESRTGSVVVPNANLGPMTVTTLEGGVELRPIDGWSLSATAFHSWLADVMQIRSATFNGADTIVFNDVRSRVTSLQNVGTGSLDGIALVLTGTIQTVTITATASVTTGRDDTGAVLMHITPAFGMTRIAWRPMRDLHVSADVRWSAAWTTSMIPPVEATLNVNYPAGGLPAWTVAGVRASYDVTRAITLQASVENIFDQQYRPAGSGISAPGRNVVAAVRVRW
ncbi:MAG: TonB-dependent receptor [Candidatus Kapabacteria bacterium]|nr:TonB-dependent receptor [Candidatus Kapabacteria bacterium]